MTSTNVGAQPVIPQHSVKLSWESLPSFKNISGGRPSASTFVKTPLDTSSSSDSLLMTSAHCNSLFLFRLPKEVEVTDELVAMVGQGQRAGF